MKKIKILVVEDNLRSQQLIVHLLTTYCPNIEIVGVAETIDEHEPDLTLIGLRLIHERNI